VKFERHGRIQLVKRHWWHLFGLVSKTWCPSQYIESSYLKSAVVKMKFDLRYDVEGIVVKRKSGTLAFRSVST